MNILNKFVHTFYTRHLLTWNLIINFYEDLSISKGLSSEDMFSDIFEIQGQSECVTEKSVSDRKEMTENVNDFSWRSPKHACTELYQMKQLLFLRFQI